MTSTDWKTHEMASGSRGGVLVTILIVGVLAAVAGTAYYVRTHIAPAAVAPVATSVDNAVPAPTAPTELASSVAVAPDPTVEPTSSSAASAQRPRAAHPSQHLNGSSAKHGGEASPTAPTGDPVSAPPTSAPPVPTAAPATASPPLPTPPAPTPEPGGDPK